MSIRFMMILDWQKCLCFSIRCYGKTNELSGQTNILTVKIDTVFETLNILRADFDIWRDSLVPQMVKNLPAMQESWLQSGLGRSPGEGNGYLLQYSYLENSVDRERSLVGYSPWGHKESDMTERLTHTHRHLSACSSQEWESEESHLPEGIS